MSSVIVFVQLIDEVTVIVKLSCYVILVTVVESEYFLYHVTAVVIEECIIVLVAVTVIVVVPRCKTLVVVEELVISDVLTVIRTVFLIQKSAVRVLKLAL